MWIGHDDSSRRVMLRASWNNAVRFETSNGVGDDVGGCNEANDGLCDLSSSIATIARQSDF